MTATEPTIISFEKASFHQGGQRLLGVLDGNYTLGEVNFLLGHNGAGKTLLLGLMHGMIVPTRGRIRLNGANPRGSRHKRGYIFQRTAMMRRSVRDNIAIGLARHGLTRAERGGRLDELLALVQLADKADLPAAVLSGGEVQRMALARALIGRPNLIFMDEPTSHLDPVTTQAFEQIVLTLAQSGIGFVWASHNRSQARRCADRIMFLDGGQIIETAEAWQFFGNPQTPVAGKYLEGMVR